MSISEKDVKLLWGRAAQMCSFPGCQIKLTEDKKLASESFPLGEQAHIVAETKNAPRGKSNLTKEERDSYHNLILLCPNHHTLIDKNPDDYTVEKLHLFKDQHEYWVEHTLSKSKDSIKTAQSVIYADLIDATVEACQLNAWDKWASRALSTNMNWDEDAHERLFKFFNKILGAVWPNTFPELECSLKRLTYFIYNGIQTFMEHCDTSKTNDKVLVEERFYRSRGWIEDDDEYHRLVNEYNVWVKECNDNIVNATKAANWFAEVVRRDINPLFFATKGKFFVIMGPFDHLEFRSYFFEFTPEEKAEMLKLHNEGWDIAKVFKPDEQ